MRATARGSLSFQRAMTDCFSWLVRNSGISGPAQFLYFYLGRQGWPTDPGRHAFLSLILLSAAICVDVGRMRDQFIQRLQARACSLIAKTTNAARFAQILLALPGP
jgi:hypothetical protein